MKLKSYSIAFVLLILGGFTSAQAVITEVHLYEMGEPGTINETTITNPGVSTNTYYDMADSVGASDWGFGDGTFTNYGDQGHFGNNLGYYTYEPSPVSGVYAGSYTNDYQWGADFSADATDNFCIEMWVRTSNTNQSTGLFATGKKTTGNVRFHCENGMWGASVKGVGYVGVDVSTNINFTADQAIVTNEWANLALVVSNGIAIFYIDGVYKPPAIFATTVHGVQSHLCVFSKQTTPNFDGSLDNLRWFTFDPVTDNPLADLTVNNLSSNMFADLHLYEMGEPGSVVVATNGVGMLQDSIGTSHWGPEYGKDLGYYTYNSSPVSGVYAGFYTNDWQWGAEFSDVPTDNFGIELWVRTSDVDQDTGLLSTGKDEAGNVRFHCRNGMWGASLKGIAYMGAEVFTNTSYTADQAVVSNKWTSLAVIRKNGVSRFYIDGVYKGETTGAAYHSDESHLGLFNGQTTPGFDGFMDNLRVFSFHPGMDDPLALLTVNNLLDIESVGSDVVVSWPNGAGPNAYLTVTTNLTNGWSTAAGSPVIVGDKYEQTVSPGAAEFFKLTNDNP